MIAEMVGQISPKMIAGTVIGVIGAAIATYWEIAKARQAGPRVRAFMVRACVFFWVWNCLFVATMLLVPKPQNWLAMPAYLVPLLIGAWYCNRRSMAIQAEDWAEDDGQPGAPPNGGPAEASENPGVRGGPPSVS